MNIRISINVIVCIVLTFMIIVDFQITNTNTEQSGDSIDPTKVIDADNDVSKISSEPTFTRAVLKESEPVGGSWLDIFGDDTAIDWDLSDSLDISEGDVQIYRQIIPKLIQKDNNTIGLWHFDEGMGTKINDETAFNNNGTLGGDGLGNDLPSWATGVIGKALLFDGVNDYVEVPDNESLRLSDAFSLVVWVKPISNGGQTWQAILEKGSDRYGLYMSGDNTFQVFNGGFSPNSIKTSSINMGEWYFLVATYDRNEGTRRIYLNGIEDASSSHSVSISSSTQPLGINRHPSNGDSHFNGIIDELAILNRSLSAEEIEDLHGVSLYNITANLTTNKIMLPENMKWDTLIFNKTQVPNTFLNVSILDASSGQIIPGIQQYTDDGEFDISQLDSTIYPSIKLRATFIGNGSASPSLHCWGVSWQGEDGFRDTFFGGVKLDESEGVVSFMGNGTLFRPDQIGKSGNGPRNGYISSIPINLPPGMQWVSLSINKSEPQKNYLNVTILNASSDLPVNNYFNMRVTDVNLTSLDPHKYSSIKLYATFESDAVNTPYLHDWTLTWIENTAPSINNLITESMVLSRMNTTNLSIDVYDTGEDKNHLTVKLECKREADPTWNDEYLSEPSFKNGLWIFNFTPPQNAPVGYYSFKITCNDSFGECTTVTYYDFIHVKNNPPLKPNLALPKNNTWVGESRPVLSWEFNDPDHGDYQTALEVWVLDIFSNLIYSSGQIQSSNNSFEIYQDLEDGKYYWQVKVCDNYGNWSAWSNKYEMNIDTKPPESPIEIICSTHKEYYKWYNTDRAVFDWIQPKDNSGISGYSYIFDTFSDTEPPESITMTVEEYVSNHNSSSYEGVVFENISDGIWHFHIRAVDMLETWSDTTTYSLKIDTKPPIIEDLTSVNVNVGSAFEFKFNLNDTMSGMDLATISWRYSSEIGYRYDELFQNNTGMYSLSHQVQQTPDRYIEYYISAKDRSEPANEIRYPATGELRVNIKDNSPPVIEEVYFDDQHNRYIDLRISVKAIDNVGINEAKIFFNENSNGRSMIKNPDGTFSIEIDRMELDDLSGYRNENEILFKVMVWDPHNNSALSPKDGFYNITITEIEDTGEKDTKKTEDRSFLDEIIIIVIMFIVLIVIIAIILFLFIRKQSTNIAEDRHKLRMVIADASETPSFETESAALPPSLDKYTVPLQAPAPAQAPQSIEEGTSPVTGYLPEAVSPSPEEQEIQSDDDQQYLDAGLMTEGESEPEISEQELSETENQQAGDIGAQQKKPEDIEVDENVYISLPED